MIGSLTHLVRIDHAAESGQLDPVDSPVIVHHPHVQRGGIDLRPLTRPGRGNRAERAVRLDGQRAAGAGGAEGVPAEARRCTSR
jgi:hypothetical protein